MLILLVGPKGSGKSHIGRLLQAHLGVHFFHVEPLWMEYHEACRREGRQVDIVEGIRRVHPAVEAALSTHARVCVETTGASPDILEDLLRLGHARGRIVARIRASLETCLRRIEARDPTNQIPMQEEMIRKAHELSEKLELEYHVTIDNEHPDDDAIVERFRTLLAQAPARFR